MRARATVPPAEAEDEDFLDPFDEEDDDDEDDWDDAWHDENDE